jgi:probable HAF family extracellular repeat protein
MTLKPGPGLLGSVAAIVLLAFPAKAGVALINLGTPGGGDFSTAVAISDHGEIAGWGTSSDGSIHAFRYEHGLLSNLDARPGDQSIASAINDAGLIVGSRLSNAVTNEFGVSYQSQAVLFDRGSLLTLEPGTNDSGAAGINNRGQIVGGYTLSGGASHAFLYRKSLTTDLGTLGGAISGATGINDRGEIVGSSYMAPGSLAYHPFLYRHGLMQDLGTLGGSRGAANAINDLGEIVGYSSTTSNLEIHPFLYSHEHMQDLGTLGGTQLFPGGVYTIDNYASAINDWGQIVGQAIITNGDSHAFVYSHEKMTDLNRLVTLTTTNGPAGFLVLTSANGINDWGQVVGVGTFWDGTQVVVRAFLMQICPEYRPCQPDEF